MKRQLRSAVKKGEKRQDFTFLNSADAEYYRGDWERCRNFGDGDKFKEIECACIDGECRRGQSGLPMPLCSCSPSTATVAVTATTAAAAAAAAVGHFFNAGLTSVVWGAPSSSGDSYLVKKLFKRKVRHACRETTQSTNSLVQTE